jgi:hypothetical protein
MTEVPCSYSTVRTYVAGVTNLYTKQVSQGYNNHPHPRKGLVSKWLNALKKNRAEHDRETFADIGCGSTNEGLTTDEERKKMWGYYMVSNVRTSLRDYFILRIMESLTLRGADVRKLELSCMSALMLENEGAPGNFALQIVMKDGMQ